MIFERKFNGFDQIVGTLVLGAFLIITPALADNGKGQGQGSGNINSGQHQNASANSNNGIGNGASSLGALNGFWHAAPNALAHAAPNSEIGKVMTYADLLKQYLSCSSSEPCTVTLQDVGDALAAAANKPLTTEIIDKLNSKLVSYDPALDALIGAYTCPAPDCTLSSDIYGSIPTLY